MGSFRAVIAEAAGTFLLIFFGCGVVHTAVLTGAQQGVWQVAIVWGVAIMLAIYSLGAISGAHINPAITLAFACWRGFPLEKVGPYIGGQLVGAMLAATALLYLFGPHLDAYEQAKGVVRGEPGSEMTAQCFGEYFPNLGGMGGKEVPYSPAAHAAYRELVPMRVAFVAELLGTAILAFVVFAVTQPENSGRPPAGLEPVFIGLTVSALISVLGPLTQACFNPARDLGPRLVAAVAGWGPVAFPAFADLSWFYVYILAPICGAILGGGCQRLLARTDSPGNSPVS